MCSVDNAYPFAYLDVVSLELSRCSDSFRLVPLPGLIPAFSLIGKASVFTALLRLHE